ncbi:phage tail assembly chaperone family protein, TAC [Pseudomonas putida]|uniref:phage tail assembly chaperone family protein, TAC n=1 Tax=Pseudomonas putida TaxID=303 RepID=UPI00236354FD|nr:phage tail assembly chaperone family protein, TAC [Pseudomonas putida]MDD2054171.1 phage tail assembly chaperone family protein, TAC [Pseudomonas putida]
MKLNLNELTKAGAFTGRPVEREITWKQGEQELTATVFVRPLGYQTAVNDVLSATGKVDSYAGRIAASICDENGNQVFTVTDITDGPLDPVELAKDPETTKRLGALDGGLTVALMMVIAQVNNLGKTLPSPTKMSSGMSSSSAE